MPATSDCPHRLVFLHGFTQTHHHWHDGADRIARGLVAHGCARPSLAFVDLPGHGTAAADTTPIAEAGGPLADLAGPGVYVGYSMGGRFALHAALARPEAVTAMVLLGATPGIVDADERAERRRSDAALADRIETIGVDRFLSEWMALPLFAGLPDHPAGFEHRRRNTAAGLASSLRTAGTGAQEPLWERLGEIGVPVLALAGGRDEKFTAIAQEMCERLPSATFATVAEAGHAAHAERPGETADAIAVWLARLS